MQDPAAQAQIINEVPPEEEEGESQDIMNSRQMQAANIPSDQVQITEETV